MANRLGQTATDNSWLSYPAAKPSTVSYSAYTLNQYTAVGSVTPTYDGKGNLTFDLGFPEQRFDLLAKAQGVAAMRVERVDQIDDAINRALADDRPFLIELILDSSL